MHPRIFIGGTGRSGTTILYRALGCHENIYALPREMRFHVEPNGIINLVDALTVRYSLNQSREALYNFECLMRKYMADPKGPYYPGYDLPNWLGNKYYYQRLDQFCAELVELEFTGISAPLRKASNSKKPAGWGEKLRLLKQKNWGQETPVRQYHFPQQPVKVVKYFPDRKQMLNLVATFVDDLFLYVAHEHGKQTWCEKTPTNLQHIDFLWELFPQSVFIHMIRDPRGVVQSMKKVRWAPPDVADVCLFLQKIYNRWFDLKEAIDVDRFKYFELRLEELAEAPQARLEQIASFCGLSNHFIDLPEITPEKINSWQKEMTNDEIKLVNDSLGPYIERLGYKI